MAFTFFYRDIHTLEGVVKRFLPLVEGVQKIKIWDAGCAMGPEPYTLLILLSEKMRYFAFKKVFMDASDIDETGNFKKIITDGIYNFDEIKRMPKEIMEKYFKPTGEDKKYIISDSIRSRLTYHQHDLTSLNPVSTDYHLIICKNVLLHLSPKQRIDVFKMYHSALSLDGILVTEQTQQMPQEVGHLFESLASDAQIFRKK